MIGALGNIAGLFRRHPLTHDKQLSAWCRFISWQIRGRLRREIVVPWIAGRRLVARRGMTGATGNIYVGLHEFVDMMFTLHFLRAGDLFLDVGANVGSYTILASGVRRARTRAFEPDPDTARDLERNIAENGLGDLVVVHRLALGDRTGEVAFTVGLDTVNRVVTDSRTDVRMVPVARLDDILGDDGPSLIKMDVEGFEEAVIAGAEAVLAAPALHAILIETTTPTIEATLLKHGFARCHYDPFARRLGREPTPWDGANALFARDPMFVESRLREADAVEVLGRLI
jgi:FkbM family methyltransferase